MLDALPFGAAAAAPWCRDDDEALSDGGNWEAGSPPTLSDAEEEEEARPGRGDASALLASGREERGPRLTPCAERSSEWTEESRSGAEEEEEGRAATTPAGRPGVETKAEEEDGTTGFFFFLWCGGIFASRAKVWELWGAVGIWATDCEKKAQLVL